MRDTVQLMPNETCTAGKAVLDDCCVPLSQCGHKTKLLLPCEGEENLYCCAPKDTKNTTTLLSPRGSEHFPEDCGLSYLGNKITEDIRLKLKNCDQSHLLQFWDDLTSEEQSGFLKQLSSINFEETSLNPKKGVDAAKLEKYRRKGLEEISKSHVAVVLLAGGQGTRLGVPYPKGMCPLGLPSGKTLFQIQAERIRSVIRLAKKETGQTGRICWYIMTSEATHKATASFLKENKYFQLNQDDVVLFKQGVLPSFSFDGKIILDRKDSVSLAPDGNGGIYLALKENDIVEDMARRGIKYVHVHSVDNILVKVADPVFIGYSVTKGADCGNKVVRKEVPTEPVGVVCQVNGRFQVVEYSEITDTTANLRDEDGNLVFRAGNICNHFFRTDFLKTISECYESELTLHVARKKVPYVNDKGERVTPASVNGIKIEKFIFDVFQYSKNFVTWEVPRHTDFSPVKNSETAESDSPFTARRDLLSLHRSYIENAGGTVACDEVEVSPLVSYAGENLTGKVCGKVFDSRTVICADEEVVMNNGGDTADIGQYPWMALLGYKQKQADFIEYLCGGTIITDKYVLTAAHCLAVGKNHELVNVRLGEHNLQSEIDCAVSLGVIYCSDKPVDVPVEEYLQHSEFDFKYIQPICLPFERTMEDLSNQASKTFIIAGWGKSGPKKVGGSPVLQFANVRIWNQSDCNLVVPPEVKPLADNQFCANGRKEDACKGDSGGPLFDLSVDATDEVRFHQLGIVSFASTVTCGIADLPSVYTRVEKHLDWILSNVN
ncbi:hypothetical protein NQ315_009590 [Exocentrus adspersus]|uniref:UDP-N-acetylglucosamine diphosphorylase n=1 Tax=Exocentrus adspersus TaxID=1586481 RepID=A0AAV8WGQ6_9CUCU|nr:hypothetical protein NQ315_009590 [Exocentrus adspersus]